MKTPRKEDSSRKRTTASLACESLEGRKLMTSVTGAADPMMGIGSAQMAGLGGGNFHRGDLHHFGGASGQGGQLGALDSFGPMGGLHGQNPMADGLGGGFDGHHFGGGNSAGMAIGKSLAVDPSKLAQGNPQLATDLKTLKTDQQAIHDKSQVTPALQASVRKDLQAIDAAKTGTADPTALKTLQTDQQAIFAAQTRPTDAQTAQIQADQDAILKSQGVPQNLIDQLATDRLAVKTASNVTPADQAKLEADMQALKKDLPTPPANPSGATPPGASNPSTWNMTTATDASTPNSTTTAAPTGAASTPGGWGGAAMGHQGGFGHQTPGSMDAADHFRRSSNG